MSKDIDVKLGGEVTKAINLFGHVEEAKAFVNFHRIDKLVAARYVFIRSCDDYILYFYKEMDKVSCDYDSQLVKIEEIVKTLFESVEALYTEWLLACMKYTYKTVNEYTCQVDAA